MLICSYSIYTIRWLSLECNLLYDASSKKFRTSKFDSYQTNGQWRFSTEDSPLESFSCFPWMAAAEEFERSPMKEFERKKKLSGEGFQVKNSKSFAKEKFPQKSSKEFLVICWWKVPVEWFQMISNDFQWILGEKSSRSENLRLKPGKSRSKNSLHH